MEKFPETNNQQSIDTEDIQRRIKDEYLENGMSEEEYEIKKALPQKIADLERQKIKIEHELTVAKQDLERKQRIAEMEKKKARGENMKFGEKLLNTIDKQLDEELEEK